MHSNVTIKNVSWPHFSWPTLYIQFLLQLTELVVQPVISCLSVCLSLCLHYVNQSDTNYNRYTQRRVTPHAQT